MEEDLEKDMTPKLIGETWRKYPTEKSTQKATYGMFECQYCGTEFETQVSSIHRGSTKSCGCLVGEKHGLTTNKFYHIWKGILRRCNNPKNKDYKNYGGRGIVVCEEWQDVTNFVAWCEATHPNIEGYSIDRIDNDNGYSPENCRWANRLVQATNQRIKYTNTTGVSGVVWDVNRGKWRAQISVNYTNKNLGRYLTLEEAVLARDNYIIENNLPHKLSTEY